MKKTVLSVIAILLLPLLPKAYANTVDVNVSSHTSTSNSTLVTSTNSECNVTVNGKKIPCNDDGSISYDDGHNKVSINSNEPMTNPSSTATPSPASNPSTTITPTTEPDVTKAALKQQIKDQMDKVKEKEKELHQEKKTLWDMIRSWFQTLFSH